MRDLLISLMCLSFSMAAYSQDWEQVKADDSCIWGEGYGPSVDEADRQALSVLVSRIAVSVVNDYRQVEEQVSSSKGNEYYSRMSNRSSAYSNVTLSNTHRIVLRQGRRVSVGRWIRREDLEKIFGDRKERILEYEGQAVESERAGHLGDALRYHYWAYVLLGVSLPSTSGVNSYTANIGKTRNKGVEFTLNGTIIDGKNGWTWDAGINLYANKNKLVALASGADRDLSNRWFVGHPIDVIYDYKKIGLWQKDDKYLDVLEPGGNVGMIKVEYTGDYKEDGTPTRQINSDDMQIMEMDPDLMGGFNTTVGYKNFDLTVIGSFQIGGKLISALHSSNGYLNLMSGRRNNIKVDYWSEENTNAKYPKPGGIASGDNPKYGSTLGYFDAGYLKIRTITLGYNFDKLKAVKNFGISKLRVYASVQNPFVFFSPFKNECGLDPETNTLSNNGSTMAVTMDGYTGAHKLPVVGYNTPATRNFIFGVNVTF